MSTTFDYLREQKQAYIQKRIEARERRFDSETLEEYLLTEARKKLEATSKQTEIQKEEEKPTAKAYMSFANWLKLHHIVSDYTSLSKPTLSRHYQNYFYWCKLKGYDPEHYKRYNLAYL